jgi:D-tyrosyl-tRNA(Tyr) deacylase
MRAVVQRCRRAHVTVEGQVVGAIEQGLVVLLGAGKGDGDADLTYMVDKVVGLRIFADDDGKMNRSVLDVGGGVLVISQFTLYGDTRKGRRPAFVDAMDPGPAEELYNRAVAAVRAAGVAKVATGVFRADMQVELVNDGPVTILLDSRKQF